GWLCSIQTREDLFNQIRDTSGLCRMSTESFKSACYACSSGCTGEQLAQNRARRKRTLTPLNNRRDSLADADTHSAERIPPTGLVKLIQSRGNQPSPAGSQRMSDGDGSSIGIDVRG